MEDERNESCGMTNSTERAVDAPQFPGIIKATLSLAYDNGGINRERSERECLRDLSANLRERWLSARHAGLRTTQYVALKAIDSWLNNLSEESLDTACNGEESEVATMLSSAPHGTTELLNDIFENVA